MASQTTILILPDEMIEQIMIRLSLPHMSSMAASCKRFSDVFRSLKYVNLESNSTSPLWLGEEEALLSRLRNIDHSRVIRANFNGIYWLDNPSCLTNFVVLCPNIRRLDLLETTFGLEELLLLLPRLNKLTNLSLTIHHNGQLDIFREKNPFPLEKLQQLTHLELALVDSVQEWDLRFLPLCIGLVSLMVPRANIFNFNIGEPIFNLNALNLRSLVFLAFPERLRTLRPFYSIQEGMVTVWSNILDCTNANVPLQSLRWNHLKKSAESVPHADTLSALKSVSEPSPVIMRTAATRSNLVLAKIHYVGMHFGSFCQSNRNIESLQLVSSKRKSRASNSTWTAQNWMHLSKLKRLSIEANLLECDDPLQNRKRKRDAADGAAEANQQPLLAVVVENCPSIEELEVLGSIDDDPDRDFNAGGRRGIYILPQELPSISICVNLSKLTIADVDIVDGLFLTEILKKCPLIEVLRLKDLGCSKSSCCYSNSLIDAIPFAKNLKTFCLFQRFIPVTHMERLLLSLGKCKQLTRVGLVSPAATWGYARSAVFQHFRGLCESCPKLVALFGHLTAPSNNFEWITAQLNDSYRKLRPAFRADIYCTFNRMMQDSYRSDKMPLMHSESITSITSKVALLPHNCNSYLQRV